VRSLLWWLNLCRLFFRMTVQSAIIYFRWSFIPYYISHVLGYFSNFVVLWAAMRMFKTVDGWGFYEVAFLYSIDLISYAIASAFVNPVKDLDDLITEGKLDEYLIRPLNPLFHLIAKNITVGYIAHITLGFAVVIVSVSTLGLHWDILMWLLFFATLAGAVLIQAAVSIIPSCAAFWTNKAGNLAGMLRWDIRMFITYPLSIYPQFVRILLTVVVPFALVNYYPSFRLLGKPDLNGLLQAMPFITLLLGIALALLSYRVWKAGLRKYNSSGS
jgi:ABC-2 type transport system permease protein